MVILALLIFPLALLALLLGMERVERLLVAPARSAATPGPTPPPDVAPAARPAAPPDLRHGTPMRLLPGRSG